MVRKDALWCHQAGTGSLDVSFSRVWGFCANVAQHMSGKAMGSAPRCNGPAVTVVELQGLHNGGGRAEN